MSDENQADTPQDPKQQMKAALDAKRAAAHARDTRVDARTKTSAGPQGKAGGKRVFRRKAGG